MKPVAAALVLAVCMIPISAVAAHGPLAWQLIGTDPDVYAPAFPQPSRDDYFRQARLQDRTFLHPRIGMSFAALRKAAQCDRVARGGEAEADNLSSLTPACLH